MPFIIENTSIDFKDFSKLEVFNDRIDYIDALMQYTGQWLDDSQNTFMFRTSGSTGNPKAIYHSRTAIVKSAHLTQSFFGYKVGDSMLMSLPPMFVAGRMILYRSIISGLDLYLEPISSEPLSSLNYPIDFVSLTPLQFNKSFNKSPGRFEDIGTVLLGGAPVGTDTQAQLMHCQSRVFHGYGMTETLTHVALRRLNGPGRELHYSAVSPEVAFSVDDHNCLIIEAAHLNEIIHANDVVRLLNSSQFEWIGRRDNIINSGGLKINPETMEAELSQHLESRFFLHGLSDPLLNQKLVLIIESDKQDAVLDKIKSLISSWQKNMKPKGVYFVDKFVSTPTHKIDRMATVRNLKLDDYIKL